MSPSLEDFFYLLFLVIDFMWFYSKCLSYVDRYMSFEKLNAVLYICSVHVKTF